MLKRANAEKWRLSRDEASKQVAIKVQQKTAEVAANNAVIAERIRTKLLKRIEAEIDKLPESIGTEMNQDISNFTYEHGKGGRVKQRTDGGKRYKLRDLTGAYKDIMGDMPNGADAADDPLLAILKRWDDASTGK